MEWLTHWLTSNSVIAWIGSFIIGITAVGAAIHKWSPVLRKYLKITSEGLELIDMLLDAVNDDKITPEEVAALAKQVQDFKEALK